ncbi:MAG: hypothetical protein NTW61_07480 [Candidatus Melainabacteria bacterium]|nr:hypothetical protein [Candidatus Melainabacteria bacterium]
MGSNNPLGNMNNGGWNTPLPNQKAPLKAPVYQSGFADIDTYINTTAQYAANTINNSDNALDKNHTPVNTLFNNNSIDTQGLFSLLGTGGTTYNRNVTLGNNISSFTSFVGDTTNAPSNSKWFMPITGNTPAPTTSTGMTMADMLQQPDSPSTQLPQTVTSILTQSPNAIAGPTGAVFGRANNNLGIPEFAGLSQEKASALAMISKQYPELAALYVQDATAKATPAPTTPPTTFTNMPSGFNQLYNSTVQSTGQQATAEATQRAQTMQLLAEVQKLISKDTPPTK